MKRILSLAFSFYSLVVFGQQVSGRYELVKMDKTINTFHHEGAPVISPDGNTLYFFVVNHPENTNGKDDSQDIWMSKKDANGNWSQAVHLNNPFNIHTSNQMLTAFDDGSLFIKGGRSRGEKGFSLVTGGSLREIEVKDFKSMNRGRFYGATMSADKKHIIMYFSEKEGAIASDLYISHAQNDGSYSRPVLMKINSNLDDVGTFIGPDQNTLYFSSARPGAGRQGLTDIYKCTRLDDTWNNWSPPVNLGKPINTSGEDFYFTIDRAGNVITSRSNKAIEGAQLDLYVLVPKTIKVTIAGNVYNQKNNSPLAAAVEIRPKDRDVVKLSANGNGKFDSGKMPETPEVVVSAAFEGFLPNQVTLKIPQANSDTTITVDIPLTPKAKQLLLVGSVYDKKTDQPVAAKLQINIKGDKKILSSVEAAGGRYAQEIPKLGNYYITATHEGYLNLTDSVAITDEELTPVTKDLYLQPIEVGVTVRLKNIYFDFDKTTLKKESFVELDKVVAFLNENPSVEIEIAGHTDAKGSDQYNLNLSQGRSQSVVDYIVSKGIDRSRMTAHGYGESNPIDTNDTTEGQANNRRVEFTVLKK
jgi:OmpA-OmpF porin, OOP family